MTVYAPPKGGSGVRCTGVSVYQPIFTREYRLWMRFRFRPIF